MRQLNARGLAALLMIGGAAFGQSASRDLPDMYRPSGPAQTVTVTLSDIGGVTAVGIEDKPPAAWTVSNISNSGAFDNVSGKVKWGPFFSPSIPTTLTYDVVADSGASGAACFTGAASFDGLDEATIGEQCIPAPIPATSSLGLMAFAALALFFGGKVLARRLQV